MSAVTTPARPRSRRLLGLDLARGLAVCTMILAHTSPWPIDLPAEYLTAPLFATLVGASLHLAWSAAQARGTSGLAFVADNGFRGACLVSIGEVLQSAYQFIDVVLQTLGLLTIVLAPVVVLLGRAARPGRAALAGASALWLISPFVMEASRHWLAEHPTLDPLGRAIGLWLAAGVHYRVVSFAIYGLVGVALAVWFARGGARGRDGLRAVGVCALVTVGAYGGGRLIDQGQPYAGDHAELLGSTAFAAGATIGCVWLLARLGDAHRTDRPGGLAPLVATGQLALTAYSLQIVLLRVLQELTGPGFDDDRPWVLGLTLAVVVGCCWAWRRTGLTGPMEVLLRAPRLLRREA
ncbi:hypothetical protein GCM10028781_16460 [Nostocoides australiense]